LASANEIPAGGEGKITVTVQAGSRNQKIRQVVNVQTNDPEHPAIQLTVIANVLVDLEVIPNILRFADNQSTAQVTLKNYSNVPVKLSEINSSNEYVKVSVSSMTIPATGEVVLTGEVLPEVPTGILQGWVKIKTDLKSMPILEIRIWGNIQK
jgi:hypothetical protein